MKKKRGVMSLWKYLVLSLAGLVGVAGVTVLVLWLTGTFDPTYIEPENISFENTLSEGKGFYNEGLEQYEVASDSFKLTITSTTENVTEDVINLSLLNGTTKDGFISDGNIKIPVQATINKPFTVTLEPTFDEKLQKNLYLGGISTLTAKSTNVLLEPQTIKIAVDCPVDSIDVKITGQNQVDEIQEISVGETFTLDTIFSPTYDETGISSKYMFSDSTRLKKVFYAQNSSAYVYYDWDNEYFVADKRSGNEYDTITVYTFKNSYYQTDFMNQVGTSGQTNASLSQQEMTDAFMQYIDITPDAYVSKSIKVKVLDIKVESSGVTFEAKDDTFSAMFDTYFTITANSDAGDATLGLSVKDTDGNTLSELNGDVGIKLPSIAREAIASRKLIFEGGKLIKVETLNGVSTMTEIDYSDSLDLKATGDGTTAAKVEYYLLPNTNPKNPDDYYWRFAMSSDDNAPTEDFEIQLNFFFKNENNILENLFKFDGVTSSDPIENAKQTEDKFFYNVKAYNEENIGWSTQAGLGLTINYRENGTAIPKTYDLSAEINSINTSNLYQTPRYFLLDFDGVFTAPETMQDYFVCSEGKLYTNDYKGELNISNLPSTAGYTLYELDSSILSAKKSFSGRVFVVFATIKTDANDKPYVDANGLYKIVKISSAKEIYVDSSLSIANMTPSFVLADGMLDRVTTVEGKYYIPVVNKNEYEQEISPLKFTLQLQSNNLVETDENNDISKILNAVNTPSDTSSLKIVNVDKNGDVLKNNYVQLESFMHVSTEGTIATFEGTLKVDKALLTATARKDSGTFVQLRLVYNDGTKEQYKDFYLDGNQLNEIYLYNQQVVSFTGVFENDTLHTLKNPDGTYRDINVEVSASTAGTTIEWGDWKLAAEGGKTVLDILNEQLVFEMLDQYGKKISTDDGLYYVRFEEIPVEGTSVLSFDSTKSKIQNFKSTQDTEITTTLVAYVVDSSENKIGKFDDAGEIITSTPISSPVLTFNVTSESIKEVWYDNNDWYSNTDKSWTKSSDTSTVTIERYVSGQDTIDLTNLIKVYTDEVPANAEETATKAGVNLEVTFDNTFLSGLGSAKDELKKMFDIELVATETAPADTTKLDSYTNKKLSALKFSRPFNERTEIIFKVTGENASLFNLTVKLVCLPTLYIDTSAFNTYQTVYSNYLATSDNYISVFAGETFALDTYAKINSYISRTIVDGDINWPENSGVVLSNTDIASITTSAGKLQLEIRDANVYDYSLLTVTLYYGNIHGAYVFNKAINLYINPNIVVQQKVVAQESDVPYLDIEDITNRACTLADNYKFYRMTDYLENGKSFDELSEFNMTSVVDGLVYVNNTTAVGKYVQIDDGAVVIADTEGLTMALELGKVYQQTFSLRDSEGDAYKTIKATRVIEHYQADGVTLSGTPTVVKCDADGLQLEYNIGLDFETSGILTDEDSKAVKTITYDNENYLLLTTNSTYTVDSNYEIRDVSGELRESAQKLRTYASLTSGYISYENNVLEMGREFTDVTNGNSIEVSFTLKAFVSAIGYDFVYYNNDTFDANNMKYNEFIYNDGEKEVSVDLKDLIELKNDAIIQSVYAGQTYTVVHGDKTAVPSSLNDAIGFYYDETLLTVGISHRVSIVETADGYVDGLATLDGNALTINHLDSEIGAALITLKFEIYKTNLPTDNFVWYYRLYVNPSYTLGQVTYPYADAQEHLDASSNYYDGEKYQLDFEEDLNYANSRYEEGYRFAQPVGVLGEITNITSEYAIANVKIGDNVVDWRDYFDVLSIEGTTFTADLIDDTTIISVEVVKTYFCNGAKMIGSERNYKFVFNQDFGYVHSLYKNDVANAVDKTNNTYNLDIVAGEDEIKLISRIQVYSNGSYINETDYNAYIKSNSDGLEVESALMGVRYIKKGATYFTDAGKTSAQTAEEDMYSNEWKSSKDQGWVAGTTATSLTVAGTTYYGINVEDIGFAYYYFDADKVLHIKPQETIEQDVQLEIGYYTANAVVFKVDLHATSYWTIEHNNTLVPEGGNSYTLYDDTSAETIANSLFKSIVSGEGTDISGTNGLKIEIVNADEIYLDYNVEDETDETKQITYGEIAQITTDENYRKVAIGFAHLPKDATFKLKVTITDGIGDYSFVFDLVVKADVDLAKVRKVNTSTGTARYSFSEFTVNKEDVIGTIEFYNNEDAAEESRYDFVDESNKITYSDYTDETIYPTQIITIEYDFGGDVIFTFDIQYQYRVEPSATVDTNYPAPNGTKELVEQTEYISTTQVGEVYKSEVFADFFNSPAPFALSKDSEKLNRVEAALVDGAKDLVTENWNIAISEVSNVKVLYVVDKENDGTNDNIGSIDPDTANKTILENYDKGTNENNPAIDFTFELIASTGEGSVVFAVSVNGVTVFYNVKVSDGNAYSASTNKPNSTQNIETIYAEDLVGKSLNIFEQGRILNFRTLPTVAANTYYVRLTKDNSQKAIPFNIANPGSNENCDLGASYLGYTYGGTYLSESDALASQNRILDADMYVQDADANVILPILTNRITASYANESITFDDNAELYVAKQTGTTAEGEPVYASVGTKISDYSISADDYTAGQMSVSPYLIINGERINLNSVYGYKIELEFDVSGTADSIDSYTTIEIAPQTTNGQLKAYSLMTGFSNLTISNKRTNESYGETGFLDSKGTFNLELYGIETLKVYINPTADVTATTEAERLGKIAGYFHYKLMNTVTPEGIIYKKGLNPSYKNEINLGTNSLENYIYLAGQQEGGNGKLYDVYLTPQGASNDGNYVMMRLSYSVKVSDTVSFNKYHNILFKVLPNSSIQFKKGASSSTMVMAINEIIDNQTVATNNDSAYKITGDDTNTTVTLWSTASADTTNLAIVANMYGNSLNTANKFTYTIKFGHRIKDNVYNDLPAFQDSITLEGGYSKDYWTNIETNTYQGVGFDNGTGTALRLEIPSIAFGEKEFLIEMVDEFGYRVRFFINLEDATNPQISSLSTTTMTENSDIIFGSTYSKMSAGADSGEVAVQSFTYEKVAEGDDVAYTNIIRVFGNENINLRLSVTDSASGREYFREIAGTAVKDGETFKYKEFYVWEGVDAFFADENGISMDDFWDLFEGDTWKGLWNDFVADNQDVINQKSWYYLDGNGDKQRVEQDIEDGSTIVENPVIGSSQDTLIGKTINVTLYNFGDSESTFEVKYYVPSRTSDGQGGYSGLNAMTDSDFVTLSVVYTVSDLNEPDYDTYRDVANEQAIQVTFSGIEAYGFETGTINLAAASALYESKVNDIQVRAVDFYYEGEWLGGSFLTDELEGKMKEREAQYYENALAQLITNNNLQFVNAGVADKTDLTKYIEKGGAYGGREASDSTITEGIFKVPYIPGIYYGIDDTLENVTMKVMLCDRNSGFSTQIATTINIAREKSTANVFTSKIVRDGNSPVVTDALRGSIYNDTLEVVLEPGAKVDFKIKATLKDGTEYVGEVISLQNNDKEYTYSEYVGISSSVPDIAQNLDYGNYIQLEIVDSSTTGVTFKYDNINIYDSTDSKYDFYIATYDEGDIKMVLEHVDEITSGNSKIEKLYFLYHNADAANSTTGTSFMEGKNTYQFTETFTVKPLYDAAHNYDSIGNVDDIFTVDNYIEMRTSDSRLVVDVDAGSTANVVVHNESFEITGDATSGFKINPASATGEIDANVIILDNSAGTDRTTYFINLADSLADGVTPSADGKYYIRVVETAGYRITYSGTEFATFDGCYEVQVVDEELTKYYIIPLVSWAKNINLFRDDEGRMTDKFLYNETYKFHFKVASTGGSVFIDENGLITTSTGFDINSHVMNIDVYMKVMGHDEKFNLSNESIKIGSFTINLNEKVDNMQNEALPVRTIGTIFAGNPDSHIVEDIIVQPAGYFAYSNMHELNYEIESSDGIFAEYDTNVNCHYALNETVVFDDILKNVDIYGKIEETYSNRTYHLIIDNKQAVVSNNLNSYAFTTPGLHEVKVAFAGRNSAGDFVRYILTNIKILVGDNSTSEAQTFECETGSVIELDSEYDWYQKDEEGNITIVSYTYDNEGTSVTEEGKFLLSDTQIVTKQFIAVHKTTGAIKNATYTYFPYRTDIEEISVALRQNEAYSLSGLGEAISKTEEDGYTYQYTYKFYDKNFEDVTTKNISYKDPLGTTVEDNIYYVQVTTVKTVTADSEGEPVTTVELIKILLDVRMRENDAEVEAMYLMSGTTSVDAIKELIKDSIGLTDTSTITLEEMDSNNVLKATTTIDTDALLTNDLGNSYKDYLVAYTDTNGKQRYVKYNITFHLYERQLEVNAGLSEPVALYTLSNLNDIVKASIEAEGDTVATNAEYSYYKLEGSTLTQYMAVEAEQDYVDTLYVKVDNKAYLIDITIDVA